MMCVETQTARLSMDLSIDRAVSGGYSAVDEMNRRRDRHSPSRANGNSVMWCSVTIMERNSHYLLPCCGIVE